MDAEAGGRLKQDSDLKADGFVTALAPSLATWGWGGDC